MRPIVGGGGRVKPRRQQQYGAGGGLGNKQPGGMPGMKRPGGPDYFGQLNAFQADISGEQPGPIQQGWGGAGGDLGTMGMTKVNSWLNTFQDPTERARAMNGIGYFNQGNPYTPQVERGTNRAYRGRANENAQTGGYSAPGTYLHQSSYGTDAGGMPDMNFGGYIGATSVGAGGEATYSPFDVNRRRGRTRPTRTFGQVSY